MVDDGHLHATSVSDGAAQQPDGSAGDPLESPLLANGTEQRRTNEVDGRQPHTRHRMSIEGPTTSWTPAGANSSLAPVGAGKRNTTDGKPHREPFAINFPASKKSLFKAPLISQVKFHWDQTEQGHILGAFFYGYILFQIPGARMAESVGARWILMAATAGSALISLIFPLSTQLNSIHLLMVLRFVMGLCQSAFFPAAYVFFCRWLPEHERSVLLPIMFIGSNMGSISTYILSSYLISSSYGWPSVFYVSGLICLLVTFFWLIFGSNGPHDNWLITAEERDYILGAISSQSLVDDEPTERRRRLALKQRDSPLVLVSLEADRQAAARLVAPPKSAGRGAAMGKLLSKSRSANDLIPDVGLGPGADKLATIVDLNNNSEPLPAMATPSNGRRLAAAPAKQRELCWSKLLRSVPIWTLILSMYGNEWSQVVLTYELPTYLNTALSFPIEQNGVINSFFQLSYTLASPIMSSLGAYLLDKHLLRMRKIHVRKLFQSLATFGQLACFLSVPICGANRGLIIMFMFSAIVFKACANAGDIMVPGDLSPEYAGTIFAFANSIGNTAGFFVPLLAGFIVDNAYEREQWTPFWLTSASIMCFSGLIFLIFGETNRQNFSVEPTDKSEEADGDAAETQATCRSRRISTGRRY